MSSTAPVSVDGTLEECLEELDELIASLERFPYTVLCFALRAHLAALLRALLARQECTRQEVVRFLKELDGEALASGGDFAR